MNSPFVSVIMPAYNHERYVGEAIESVLNQSFSDLELIIINDGSTDETEKIIKGYGDKRIKYYYQDNSGAHNAINRGLSSAKGKYISIINSDDVYHSERLSFLIETAKAKNAVFIITGVELIDESSAPVRESSWFQWYSNLMSIYQNTKSLERTFLSGNIAVTTSNFFFHSLVPNEIGLFSSYRYAHDYDFVLRILLRYPEKFIFIADKKKLYYRWHEMNTIKESSSEVIRETLEVIIKYIPEFIGEKEKKEHLDYAMNHILNEIHGLIWEISSRDAVIRERDWLIMEKDRVLQEKESTIEGIVNTMSWKITAPLRWGFGKLLKAIGKCLT